MKLIKKCEIEVKKSKFIAYNYKIENENEAKDILEALKKEHKKARHIPYAYKIGNVIRKSDDKEPSNTAGTLDKTLIAVVRYFGGTLLGAGLLTRSYSNAANQSTSLE